MEVKYIYKKILLFPFVRARIMVMVQFNESAPLDDFTLWFDVEFTTTLLSLFPINFGYQISIVDGRIYSL
jgi:hypothetical protein